ncbi:MAG: YggT family protein [Iamia sp.]
MDPILRLLCLVTIGYQLVILGAIIISWFPLEPGSGLEGVRNGLQRATEPVLGPVRRALPPVRLGGMALDLSPIIVLIGLQVLQVLIC